MTQNSIVLPTTGTVSGLQMTQSSNAAFSSVASNFSGASSPSSTLDSQFWVDTTNNLLKIRNSANTQWITIGSLDQSNNLFFPIGSQIPPQGRLTLSSGAPIMTADVTGATSIYYAPYIGNLVPIYNGSVFVEYSFTQQTLSLTSSAHSSGKLYDIFAFLNASSVINIGTGIAWTTTSSRAATISSVNGLWVNTSSMTMTNGSSTSSVAASSATYLGTFYATANASSGIQFKPTPSSGGTNNIIGIFNAYNRVPIMSKCSDSSSGWTYSSNSWRTTNGSSSNRITYVDGLAVLEITASIANMAYNLVAGNGSQIGIVLNASSGTPNVFAQSQSASANTTVGSHTINSRENFFSALGLNFVQGMENSPNATSSTFAFNGNVQYLLYEATY